MTDEYGRIVEKLIEKVRPGFGGSSRPAFVAEIGRLTREIERLGDYHSYVQEKAGNVREWVGIACSQRRFEKWGLDKVEMFAFQDAYKLKRATNLIDQGAS